MKNEESVIQPSVLHFASFIDIVYSNHSKSFKFRQNHPTYQIPKLELGFWFSQLKSAQIFLISDTSNYLKGIVVLTNNKMV